MGRSCVVLHIGGVYVMMDCGMHLAFRDARRWAGGGGARCARMACTALAPRCCAALRVAGPAGISPASRALRCTHAAARCAPPRPRRFPDFSLLSFHGRLTEMLTAVIITHFHLDHCAALPYLTEVRGGRGRLHMAEERRVRTMVRAGLVADACISRTHAPAHDTAHGGASACAPPSMPQVCGYHGPIFMTFPTKAIMPIMLEDYHKVRQHSHWQQHRPVAGRGLPRTRA